MKVHYDSKKNAYLIEYINHVAKITGGVVYVRCQRTAGKKKPSAEERKEKIKYWENWAKELEDAAKEQWEKMTRGDFNSSQNSIDLPILAIDYLESLEGEAITTATNEKQIKDSKNYIKSFIDFLKINYKEIYLHQINKKIATEFIGSLSEKSYSYKENRWVRLGYVFKRIVDKFEDSELNYKNPFHSIKLGSLCNKESVKHKKVLQPEMIRDVLKEALGLDIYKKGQTKIHKFQRWAILYLLALTGIRPIDIFGLKWSQIDLERRIMQIEHQKTKRFGISTVIWLTPHLMELFITLKELHKKFKSCDESYVFSFLPKRYTVKNEMDSYIKLAHRNDLNDFFKKYREKKNLKSHKQCESKKIYDYSVYSLRTSVASILSWKQFNKNQIDYLQGHAVKNVTAEFYLDNEQNPKQATAFLIDYMAYFVCQQKLSKIGLEYAYKDAQDSKKEIEREKQIKEEIERIKDGSSLLIKTLEDKLEAEAESRNKMADDFGQEIAEFLKEH